MAKVLSKIKKFIDSIWYSVALCAITLLSFILDAPYLGFYLLVFSLVFILLCKSDLRAVIPILILTFGNHQHFIRDYKNPWFIILIVIFVLETIVFFINIIKDYKKYIQPFKRDFIFYSLLLILASMLLSLINTPVIKESLVGIVMWTTIMFTYILVRGTVEPTEKNRDYIITSILLCGIVLCLEVVYKYFFELGNGYTMEEILDQKLLSLGWANINHIAAFANICILLSIYYFIKHKDINSRLFTMFSLTIYCFITIISVCRGGYITLLVTLPIALAVYIYYQIKSEFTLKKDAIYFGGFILFMGLEVLLLHLTGFLSAVTENVGERGFDPSGRSDVYKIAWERFVAHPIFGSGVYTSRYFLEPTNLGIYNYHNYYLQILATCGIIGGLAFTMYLIFSIKRILKRDLFSVFTLIITIYFLIHGLIDTIYFNTYIMPILCVLLALNQDSKLKDEFPNLFKKKEYEIESID